MARRTDIPVGEILLRDMLEIPADNHEQLAVARRALRDVLEHELTPQQRATIYLRYYEGLRPCEIARRQGVHPSTVTRSLQRARLRIYKCMRFYFDYRSIRFEAGELR